MKKSEALVVQRTEKIPLDNADDIKLTETRHTGNTTLNQSHNCSNIPLNQSKIQTDKLTPPESVFLKPTSDKTSYATTKNTSLLSLTKTKKVSISDDVEEFENKIPEDLETDVPDAQPGRKVTVKKHISAPAANSQANECKTQ